VALVPLLDLAPPGGGDPRAPTPPPASIQTEQGFLGCVLYDNDVALALSPAPQPHHFFEPFHGKIWEAVCAALRDGRRADPFLLAEEFRSYKAFRQLGGHQYLADLLEKAPAPSAAQDYGAQVIELWARRELMRIGRDLAIAAGSAEQAEGGSGALIADLEKDLLTLSRSDAKLSLLSSAEVAARALAWVDDRSHTQGVFTGLAPLDLQLGPLLAGNLIVIAGRPAMGKSALAGHIALRVAGPRWWWSTDQVVFDVHGQERLVPDPKGVIEINCEMSEDEMGWRHLSDIGFQMFGKDFPTYEDIRNKKVGVTQRDMLEKATAVFAAMPIKSIKRTAIKLSEVRSIVRRQAAEWAREGIDLGLVVVDHGGLVRPDGKVTSRYEAQTEIAQASKTLAGEVLAPVIMLLQLNRDVDKRDDKRPHLEDLRESGEWEQSADAVLLIYRDAYYAEREGEPEGTGDKATEAREKWDRRRRSKIIEIGLGKKRWGKAGRPVEIWGAMGWNALRGTEPPFGDLV
jgi:replicative DNA helicase